MNTLIEKCRRKIRLVETKNIRSAMSEIAWDSRLIAIRGAKGVGKTTLMLQRLKLDKCDCKTSLYISLDDTYFVRHRLDEFVDEFYKKGGKRLMIDEVHKYPGWSKEIKQIYDDFPDLTMVVSGSSFLQILNGDADLSRRCIPYDLQGLSYREFLQIDKGLLFPIVTFNELVSNPQALCDTVNEQCRPLSFFEEYLQRGYYPFFLEGKGEYLLRVENVVNYIINVELPQLCKVEVGAIRKLQTLLSIAADSVPLQVDISKMSVMAGVSRQTVLGYLQYLYQARLLNLLYSNESNLKKMQKPDKVYLENPNLMYALSLNGINQGTLRETFLVNQLKNQHRVEYVNKGDLIVDGTWTIEIGGRSKDGKQIAQEPNAFIAADEIENPAGNKIPLWAFGFLY